MALPGGYYQLPRAERFYGIARCLSEECAEARAERGLDPAEWDVLVHAEGGYVEVVDDDQCPSCRGFDHEIDEDRRWRA